MDPKQNFSLNDRCICCGEPLPEGRTVCKKCEILQLNEIPNTNEETKSGKTNIFKVLFKKIMK